MVKNGIVVKTDNNKARVAILRTSACGGGCDSCGGCETSEMFIDLPNTINAKVGDEVRVRSKASKIFFLSFLTYIIPLVILVGSIVLSYSYFKGAGNDNYELLSFGVGLLSFVVSAIFLRFLDKRVNGSGQGLLVLEKTLGNIAD